MHFTPLTDFFSEELRSQYCVGLSYTVRPRDTLLAALVPTWLAEGKVRHGAPNSPVGGRVAGTGNVGG